MVIYNLALNIYSSYFGICQVGLTEVLILVFIDFFSPKYINTIVLSILHMADKGTIAPLILLLTLLLILYVIMLPPESREELLGEEPFMGPGTGDNQTSGQEREEILLRKYPGTLDKLDFREVRNSMPSMVLYADFQNVEVSSVRNIYTESTVFGEQRDTLSFTLSDPANYDDLLLSFTAKGYKGRLVIKLNEQVVFNDYLSQPTINPIKLPENVLKNDNVIEFRVSSPGWKFWRTNKYSLENVKVTGQYQDVSALKASTSFVSLDEDLRNTNSVVLKYVAECKQGQVGRLDVVLNDNLIKTGVPLCGDLQAVEFDKAKLNSGENTLVFSSNKGSFVVDNVEVIQFLKEPTYQTYYFEMDEEEVLDLLEFDNLALNMYLQFADDEFHNLDVFVNGHVIHVDEKSNRFIWNIEPFLFTGTNAIKLIPRSKGIDIAELVLQFEKV